MNTNQDTALTNQDAFLKEYTEITGMQMSYAIDAMRDEDCVTVSGRNIHISLLVWQASTKASESEINSLKERVAELQASNNKLREALEIARKEYERLPRSLGYEFTHLPIINKALSSTPAQSLAEHDNATIDRCKNIVADDAIAITFQSMGAYRSAIIKHIGELKVTP